MPKIKPVEPTFVLVFWLASRKKSRFVESDGRHGGRIDCAGNYYLKCFRGVRTQDATLQIDLRFKLFSQYAIVEEDRTLTKEEILKSVEFLLRTIA